MQKTSPLSEVLIRDIEAKRDWVKNQYAPDSLYKYNTVEGKLVLLNTILKSNWIEPTETLKLQCLGITLGDIFVQDMNFEWIEVEDEYGTDPALQLPGTSILIFPQTMISKRIENGEVVNIYEFYEGLKTRILEIRQKEL